MMIELFVPGRLCLFGEHSDWAGGYRTRDPRIEPGECITAGTDQGIRSMARRCPGRFRARSCADRAAAGKEIEVSFSVETLRAVAETGGFWSYAAGTALAVLQAHQVDGIELECYAMDLPLRKGLSSSASICVSVARAFNLLYELGLSIREEMELAYLGEILTPSRCGRMDQVCAFGKTTCLLVFDGDDMRVERIATGDRFYLLIVDLGGTKDTIRILASLNACFPDRADATANGVRRALGASNREIGAAAKAALERGDASMLGALMRNAQDRFDRLVVPACPEELTAPLLHSVLSYPPLQELIHGGKGVGSQGDGCAQLVCRGPAERDHAKALLKRDLGMTSLELTLG